VCVCVLEGGREKKNQGGGVQNGIPGFFWGGALTMARDFEWPSHLSSSSVLQRSLTSSLIFAALLLVRVSFFFPADTSFLSSLAVLDLASFSAFLSITDLLPPTSLNLVWREVGERGGGEVSGEGRMVHER
jgi:hypothetical protein